MSTQNELKGLYNVPGTLIYTGNNKWSGHEIILIQYNESEYSFKKLESLENLELRDDVINWIVVRGIEKESLIRDVGDKFNIHNMVLEDIVEYSEDCKVDFYEDFNFYSLNTLNIYEKIDRIIAEKISIIKMPNLVISFHESSKLVINKLITRLDKKQGYIRKMNEDYLVFAIIDHLMDSYLQELSKLTERILEFENKLLNGHHDKFLLQSIFNLKKQVSDLRRYTIQLKEMTKSIHSYKPKKAMLPFYKDLRSKSTKLHGLAEGFKDDVSTLIELKFSLSNDSMNQVMKTLTMISTIFIPLSFLTGFYGMNFKHMPELTYKLSYPILIIFMLIIVVSMLRYFKNKKWF